MKKIITKTEDEEFIVGGIHSSSDELYNKLNEIHERLNPKKALINRIKKEHEYFNKIVVDKKPTPKKIKL